MTFRLSGKQLFLTYPKCDLSPAEAVDQLTSLLPCSHWIAAQELHEDGSKHLHVYLRLQRKANVRNVNFLDLQKNSSTWHGNYQTCRSAVAVQKYVRKEGNFVSNMPVLTPKELCEAGKVTEAIKQLWDERFLMMARYGTTVEANLRRRYLPKVWIPVVPTRPWGDLWDFDWDTSRSLLLIGPSGIGKTTWAMSRDVPTLMVTDLDDLKKFDADFHKCILFDDMDFRTLNRTSCIHLVDTDFNRSIRIRYISVQIPAGTEKIFSTNVEEIFNAQSCAAIQRRIQIVDLNHDLASSPSSPSLQ